MKLSEVDIITRTKGQYDVYKKQQSLVRSWKLGQIELSNKTVIVPASEIEETIRQGIVDAYQKHIDLYVTQLTMLGVTDFEN